MDPMATTDLNSRDYLEMLFRPRLLTAVTTLLYRILIVILCDTLDGDG